MRTWPAVLAAVIPAGVLAALGLSHPHLTDLDSSAWWRDLHVVGLASFPLLALAPWLSVRGRGRTAEVVVGALGLVYVGFYMVLDLVAELGAPSPTTAVGPGPWVAALFGDSPGPSIGGAWAYLAETAVAVLAVVVGTRGRRRVAAGVGGLVAIAGAAAFLAGWIYYPVGVATMVVVGAGQTALAVAATWVPAESSTVPATA